MVVVLIAVIAVLAVAGYVLLRANRYGGFKAAFGGAVKDERRALAAARANVKRLEKERSAELERAQRAHEAAAAVVQGLEEPGDGGRVTRLGKVKLHEHVIYVSRERVPLAGLSVRCESGPSSSFLYITGADGRMHSQSFSTEWKSTGKITTDKHDAGEYDVVTASEKMTRDFSDEQVRALAVAVSNQVIAEAQFIEELPTRLDQARSDLEGSAVALRDCQEGSQTQTALEEARTELGAVEGRWAEVVGSSK